MTKQRMRRWSLLLALTLVTLLAAACNDQPPAPEVEGEPVVSAQTPSNASRLPNESGRLALVEGETQLRDFVLDEDAGVAYVTDSDYVLHIVGLDPLPKRTALKAQITGRLEREDYRIEKVVFQSMPGLYVT